MKRFYLSLLIAIAIAPSTRAEVWETQVEQSSREDGAYAQFRLWVPPGSHPDRLIALTWGGNQCSLDLANDLQWQNLAKSTRAGLLTCFYVPQSSNNHWDYAAEGSGQALLDALQTLAQLSGETQLAKAQLYMVGDSQGGQFSFSFASWKPDQVLGFVSLKGGRHEPSAVETAASVPGLFFVGGFDVPYRIENIERTFVQGRIKGAPWCLAIDKQGNHEPGPCAPLLRAFLQELSACPKPAAPVRMTEADHGAIDPSALSWFPSSRFESEWTAFESGKPVASALDLSFESKMPALDATIVPSSCNLGSVDSGEKSQPVTIKVFPGASSQWDGVKILNQSNIADAEAVNVASSATSISFKLNTEGLPLGRFSGVIPIRFVKQGKPVLGGLNVPVTANVVGDVSADPAFVYLEPIDSIKTNSVKIEIHSRSNETIKLISFKTPPGISITSELKSEGALGLTVLYSHVEKDPTTGSGGAIWLYLETSKKWIIRIPCFDRIETRP